MAIKGYAYGEYTAVLYGERSMVVKKNGREVLHTGFRNVETEEEVIDLLKQMPQFEDFLTRRFEDDDDDADCWCE